MTVNERIAIFILLLAFLGGVLFLTGTMTSGYHFADDHEIIRFSNELSDIHGSFLSIVSKQLAIDSHVRFRPFYYIHRIYLCYLFGHNFFAWHLYNWFLAVLSLYFLYLFSRRLGFNLIEGSVLAFLPFFGEQSEIWWRLGPNETIGLFMLALCLFFMGESLSASRYRVIHIACFILFAILASLSKESFILFIPAIILWYILLKNKTEGRPFLKVIHDNLPLILIFCLIVTTELLYIYVFVGSSNIGYAGVDHGSSKLILEAAKDLFVRNGIGIAIIIGFIMALIRVKQNRSNFLKDMSLPILLLLVMIAPQIVLYAKSGMTSRYLLPAALGLSIFSAYLIRNARKQGLFISTSNAVAFYAALISGLLAIAVTGMIIALLSNKALAPGIGSHIMSALLLGISFSYLSFISYRTYHKRQNRFSITDAGILFCLFYVVFLFNVDVMYSEGKKYGSDGHYTTQFLSTLINKSGAPDSFILIAINPTHHFEAAYAAHIYLNLIGNIRNVCFRKILPSNINAPFDQHLADSFDDFALQSGLKLVPAVNKHKPPQYIGLLPGTKTLFEQASRDWFIPEEYILESIGPFVLLSRIK